MIEASAKATVLIISVATSVTARAACICFCAMRPAKSLSKKVTACPSVQRCRRDSTSGSTFGPTMMRVRGRRQRRRRAGAGRGRRPGTDQQQVACVGEEALRAAADRGIDDPAQDQGRNHLGRPGDAHEIRTPADPEHRPGPAGTSAKKRAKRLRRRACRRASNGRDQAARAATARSFRRLLDAR